MAIGSLAGCSAGASAAAGGQTGPTVITVDSVPASEEGGLYVAAYAGFFAQQGLTVKIKPITGGEAGIPDLQAGRADLVAGNYVSFILAQMAGKFDGKPASMRIIAAGSELQPGSEALYVMPRLEIQDRRLARAVPRPGGAQHAQRRGRRDGRGAARRTPATR